jgi:hypothetical protein
MRTAVEARSKCADVDFDGQAFTGAVVNDGQAAQAATTNAASAWRSSCSSSFSRRASETVIPAYFAFQL